MIRTPKAKVWSCFMLVIMNYTSWAIGFKRIFLLAVIQDRHLSEKRRRVDFCMIFDPFGSNVCITGSVF